jgi:superfamily II DNA or RNA helicase
MSILHGCWLESDRALFVWSETWRSRGTHTTDLSVNSLVPYHPTALSAAELWNFLRSPATALQAVVKPWGDLRGPIEALETILSYETSSIPQDLRSQDSERSEPDDRPTDAVAVTDSPEDSPNDSLEDSPEDSPEVAAVPVYRDLDREAELDRLDDVLVSIKGITPAIKVLWLPTPVTEGESGQTVAPQASFGAEDAPPQDRDLELQPWQVQGLILSPEMALTVLAALPLGGIREAIAYVGADLRFWSHVARWTLDVIARGKVVPELQTGSDGVLLAIWRPLLDSARDSDRRVELGRAMPLAARATELSAASEQPPARNVLISFLDATIDARMRQLIADCTPPSANTIVKAWAIALMSPEDRRVAIDLNAATPLQQTLSTWTEPVRAVLDGRADFRTAIAISPPTPKQDFWRLSYGLQAIDDPDFFVDAGIVWKNPVDQLTLNGRTIDRPQETFLSGLGRAAALYPLIEASLDAARPIGHKLNPIEAYEFLKSYRWRLSENGLGVILPESLAKAETWSSRLGLSVRALPPQGKRLGLNGLLNFEWELTIAGQAISQAEFTRLISQGSPLVEVNGTWVELRMADVRAANGFFAQRRDRTLSLEDALRMSSGETQTIDKLPVVNFEASGALHDLLETLTGKRTIEPITTTTDFCGTLRPYQARGVGWMRFLERWGLGACLADDMGLGKTIQTIAFLLSLKAEGNLDTPVLLVCPTSVLGNWEREIRKFAANFTAIIHHGEKRAKGKAFTEAIAQVDLVLTSYALVQRDLKLLEGVAWRAVILDEAQNIKNAGAKQSQAVRQLAADFRLALTGTPVENRLSELWSILDFLNPGYLGTQAFFKKRFALPIEKYGDTDSLTTLRSLVQPFILRRLKTDKTIIHDLPEKQEMTVFCPLTDRQAQLYQATVETSLAAIESSHGIERHGHVLALLTKLKQVCNHPELLGLKGRKQKLLIDDQFAQPSGKLQRLEAMLEEVIAEGDRALIFTQFAEWGKVLQPYLEHRFQREVFFLYGATKRAQREAMLDRFQHDPQGPPICILSLKAGGTGLNLTRANHVFHFDRWWNPAVENQATDRVFRIGQTRNVQVHKFVCTGTLEERIHDLIESKQALADQAVGAGESWLTELDTDGLRNLLLLDRTAAIASVD